jgi:ATP-binding cassette subfamily B multidrug efflux pump
MLRWFETRIDPFRRPPDGDPPSNVVGFYWYFLKQAPLPFVALIVAVGLSTVLEVIVFVQLGRAVDAISGFSQQALADVVRPLYVLLPAILLAQLAANLLHITIANQTIWPPLGNLIRWQSHLRVVRRRISFFQGQSSGTVAYQVHEISNSVIGAVVSSIQSMWSVAVLFASSVVVFAAVYWVFLIPLILWAAGAIAIAWFLVPRTRKASERQFEQRSRVSGQLAETYSNIVAVKLFGATDREDGNIRSAIMAFLAALRKTMGLNTIQYGAVMALNSALTISVFMLALWGAVSNAIPVGDIVVATALVLRLQYVSFIIVSGVTSLAGSFGTVESAMKSIAPKDPEPAPRPPTGFSVREGALAFRSVTFRYGEGDLVLDGLTFDVDAKSSLGVVGLSGAGKTTILNLAAGLYSPDSGSIAVDGRDIGDMAETELWAGLSVVTQEPMLFNRSVRENLLYGRADATDAELEEVLAKVSAIEFVSKLVDNDGRKALDAHIGERGVKLSGGQRQRLAIARALLKDAPLLILDEPTSALDSETEAAIQETFASLRRKRTLLVIAHRVSTVAHLDRLIVLDQGRVVETGTHDELVAHGGLYSRFWRLQTEGGGTGGRSDEAADVA